MGQAHANQVWVPNPWYHSPPQRDPRTLEPIKLRLLACTIPQPLPHGATARTYPALSPQSPAIRIISRSFPWTLDINGPATCAAVFEGLYDMLQKPIADSEWGTICEESRCRTIMKAAKARTGTTDVDELKRIDWLGDMTAFKGLEKDSEFERKRLLPGTAPCPETWVVKWEAIMGK
ncbi:hypothetical protein EDC04DRAFT_3088108 [Pisolithus marmoratus]|nr:hypothetical protein EDC04DRAFT_3088108 [Pisolithus marmoratus]